MQDAILLYDSLLNSRQFQDEKMLKVWIYLLLTAQKEEGFVSLSGGRGKRSVKVGPGQLILQRNTDAERLEMKPSTLRNIIDRLIFDGCIVSEVKDNQYTVITLVNRPKFKQYTNGNKQYIEPVRTSIGQPKDNQRTTKKAVEKEPIEYWNKLVDVWFKDYKKRKGTDPTFEGKDQSALKAILKNLQSRSEKSGEAWSEETAVSKFQIFLDWSYAQKWIADHYLLANLYSQFDAINAKPNGETTSIRGTSNGAGIIPAGRDYSSAKL